MIYDKAFEKRFKVGSSLLSLLEIINKGRGDLTKDILEVFEMLETTERFLEGEELIYKLAIKARKIYSTKQMKDEANNCKLIKEILGRRLGRN